MARPISPEDTVPGAPPKGGAGSVHSPSFPLAPPRAVDQESYCLRRLIFGLEFSTAAVLRSLLAFAVFCVLSGVVYSSMTSWTARRPPASVKARRPIGSAPLSPPWRRRGRRAGRCRARGRVRVGIRFGAVAVSYLLLQSPIQGRSAHRHPDVLAISLGSCVRRPPGRPIDVPISHWLLVVTILLALFSRSASGARTGAARRRSHRARPILGSTARTCSTR